MQNFEEKKWSGDMVKRCLSTKVGINLPDGGSEKTGFMDEGTDGRRTTA